MQNKEFDNAVKVMIDRATMLLRSCDNAVKVMMDRAPIFEHEIFLILSLRFAMPTLCIRLCNSTSLCILLSSLD